MNSTSICKIIFYKRTNETDSYIFYSMYDICVGTTCEELGLTNQYFFDLSKISKGSNKDIINESEMIIISCSFPKVIDGDLFNFIKDYHIDTLEPERYLDRPIIVLIEENFNFDIIKEYISTYSEYGTKECT